MPTPETITLYRPVGLHEARLIVDSGRRCFPPRLPEQPIFYPVLTREYAEQIACEWNTCDMASGYAGFVTRFAIDREYSQHFPVHVAGAEAVHRELWVPAGELPEFNAHIVGIIEFIAVYYGELYRGPVPPFPIS